METIELTARSLDEARRTAAERLGVAPDAVELTVLEETKGLFGKTNYRVRASAAGAAPATPAAEAEAPAKPARPSRSRAKAAPEPEPEPEAAPEPAPEPEAEAPAPKRAKRGGKKADAEAAPEAPEADEAEPAEEVVATREDAEAVADMVREILDLADLDVDIQDEMVLNGRYINLSLYGRDVAYLVGKHGEVLNAFQYLVNVMIRQQMDRDVRVTLDGNHYRERRAEALTKLAVQIAEQVRERGEEAVLDALPAFERRVVHHALQEMEGISTYSEGEEPNRRVVIAPAE